MVFIYKLLFPPPKDTLDLSLFNLMTVDVFGE